MFNLHRKLPTALLFVVALAGCGETISGELGRVEPFLTDVSTGHFTGDLNGNVQVSISSDGNTWYDLGSPNGITVPLQSDTPGSVHGEQDAPSGNYEWVRVTFTQVEAQLPSGTTIGTTTLASDTDVPLGGSDQTAVIAIRVPQFTVEVSETTRRTIIFTLNSDMWMTEWALQAMTVEDIALESAITAAVTTDPRS